MLVVESVIEAAAVSELDDALAFPRRIHVGIRHFSGRAEEVFQVLRTELVGLRCLAEARPTPLSQVHTCHEVLLERLSTMIR